MIRIEISVDDNKSVLEINGVGERLLKEEIIPAVQQGRNPALKKDPDALKELISELIKGFVRQNARLW